MNGGIAQSLRRAYESHLESLGFSKEDPLYPLFLRYFLDGVNRGRYIIEFLREFVEADVSGKIVLECGCGDGSLSMLASESGGFAGGLDVEEKTLMIGKQFWGGPNFIVADALHLPFRSGVFDIIFAVDLMDHVKDHNRLSLEVWRAMKGEGILLLKIANRAFPLEPHTLLVGISFLPRMLADVFINLLRKDFFKYYSSYKDISLMTYWEVSRVLGEGFHVRFVPNVGRLVPSLSTSASCSDPVGNLLPNPVRRMLGSRHAFALLNRVPFLWLVKDWLVIAKKRAR